MYTALIMIICHKLPVIYIFVSPLTTTGVRLGYAVHVQVTGGNCISIFFWRGGIGQFLGNHLNFNLFSCIKQFQIFYWHISFSWRFVWQCHSVMNSVFLLKEFIITNTTFMAIHVCVTIEWTFFIVLNMPEIFTTEH